MSTAIWTALSVLLLLANLAAHETAHALALRGLGGRIREAGLGLPFPPRLEIRSDRVPFTMSLSPWLLGAYVQPDHDSEVLIDGLAYRDKAWFAGAGVVANLIIGLVGLAGLTAANGAWLWTAVTLPAAGLLWVGRRIFTAYLLLPCGVAALVFTVVVLIHSVGQPQGPIGLAQTLVTDSGRTTVVIAIALSFSLALLNMIPAYPFDGGRVADAAVGALFGERAAARFRVVTGVIAVGFVLYSIGSDVWWAAT